MKRVILPLLACVLLCTFVMPVGANEIYTWVAEPVYDYIGLPGTTKAPYFTYVKNGAGGYLDGNGQPIFDEVATSDMSASAFYTYSDGNAYAIRSESSAVTILKQDGSELIGEEALLFLAANAVVPEDEIVETIVKTTVGDFDKQKTISYTNAQGQLLFEPIFALNAGAFHSGIAVVETEKDVFALLDEAGVLTPVTDVKLSLTGFYYEDLCIAEKDGKFGLVKLTVPRGISVRLNGKKVYFDQQPVIQDDRTLVPVRAIFEALDATVSWDGTTRTVSAEKDGQTVSLVIDDVNATVNGKTEVLDVPAKIINDRTMVPLRFIAQSFGARVDWDGATRTAIITANE